MEVEQEISLEDAIGADIDAAIEEQKGAAEAEEQGAKYARDEAGRFAKKQAEDDAAAEAKLAEPVKPANGADPQAPPPAASPWKPLWYKDEYGQWDQLSEAFRTKLQEREREAAQGIEKHATAAKAWEPINEVIKPFEHQLRLNGQTPQQFVGGLINIYQGLQDENRAVETLNWLISQRFPGHDIMSIADWMHQQNYQPQRVDPMQQELAALKQELAQLREAPVRQQREALQGEIAAWSKDKPHFEDLREYMAALAKTPQYKGATLDQLYEAAQYAHPQLRERILTDQRKREVSEARVRGAQSPRGTPDEGAKPSKQKPRSVEDDLKEAFEEAGI